MDGEDVSEWFVDGADVGIWNIFLMSIMGLAGVDVAAAAPTGGVVEDDEADRVVDLVCRRVERDDVVDLGDDVSAGSGGDELR